MIKLDTSQIPPRVAAVLMQRGAQLPPIQWHINPNQSGKRYLDESTDDKTLLGCDPLADDEMAAAVRALLFFWNGWPAESVMHAHLAPDKERGYIDALIKRQAGDSAASKDLLQKISEHPIYKPLGDYATEEIGLSVAPGLKRLREVIAFGELWEPYAYADVYEQARAGQLDPAGERVVRSLQCREFELLFAYCLEAATGRKLARH